MLKFYRIYSLMCTYVRLNIIVGFLEGPMSPSFWPLPLAVHRLQEEEQLSQTLKPKRRCMVFNHVTYAHRCRGASLLCFPEGRASAGGAGCPQGRRH